VRARKFRLPARTGSLRSHIVRPRRHLGKAPIAEGDRLNLFSACIVDLQPNHSQQICSCRGRRLEWNIEIQAVIHEVEYKLVIFRPGFPIEQSLNPLADGLMIFLVAVSLKYNGRSAHPFGFQTIRKLPAVLLHQTPLPKKPTPSTVLLNHLVGERKHAGGYGKPQWRRGDGETLSHRREDWRHANFGRESPFLLQGLSYMKELFPGRCRKSPRRGLAALRLAAVN
jgi:hypothetical protein